MAGPVYPYRDRRWGVNKGEFAVTERDIIDAVINEVVFQIGRPPSARLVAQLRAKAA